MQRVSLFFSLVVVCLTTITQAQTPTPKPGPEVDKLHVFVGHWTGVGESKPSPWGPGGKYTFEETDEMILGGFFLQAEATFKPVKHNLWIMGYDPVNKNYPVNTYFDNGRIASWTMTVDGNTYSLAAKVAVDGKQYLVRNTMTFAPDLMSFTTHREYSSDGNTWEPLGEEKITKIKPAAKK